MEPTSQSTNTLSQLTGLGGEALIDEAYARVKPELDALNAEDLQQVNLDVTAAVTTILGLLPEVKALREQIVNQLPTFNILSFDKLEDYALALSFANTIYLKVTQPPDDLAQLNADATKLHDQLLADAQALAQHGLLNGTQLGRLQGGNGYKNLAQDLQLLSSIMREGWDKIVNKSATTADDLKAANQMSVRLMRIVGLREQGPALLADATDQRLRAFTLFITIYEDVRRAVAYLRGRQGDADTIAPSLYPGRPRKRTTDPGGDTTAPTVPQPPAGSGTPAQGTTGAGSAPSPAATGGGSDKDHPFMS